MRVPLRFGGLRSRLVVPVLIATLPATWLVIQTANAWRRHEVADALAAGNQLTRHASAVHARALNHAHRTLATIASTSESIDPASLQRLLRTAVEGGGLFVNAGVFEVNGDVVVAHRAIDQRTVRELRTLLADPGTGVGDYVVDAGTGRITLLLAQPVERVAQGSMRRFAFGVVELTWLDDAIERATLPADSVITIFDRHARMLVRNAKPPDGNERHKPAPAVIRAVLAGGEGTAEATDSVPRVYAYAPLFGTTPSEHLYMSVAISKASAAAAANQLLQYTTIALVLATAFAVAVACVSSGRLSREMEALVATTARLTDGDMSARTGNVEATPELTRLATSLDTLAGALGNREREHLRRREELAHQDRRQRAMHEELEARVLERTVELVAANQALHRLSSAIEQTADSVFITNCNGVIEYVNPAFETMTGYSRSEAVGQTPRLFASQLHDQKFYEGLWTTILSGRVFRTIVTNRMKNGQLFNEDQTITPVRDAGGTITHFVSTGRDITERRRTEQALRRLNNEFENQAARIAAMLHDEAGQFLASAHITLADVARDLPPEMRSRVQQVRSHLDQAEQQLRHVSHALHPRMLDDLGLTDALQFLSTTFGRRTGVSVQVDLALDMPCPRPVEAVIYRFVQEALTNIGKHAKATQVSIRLEREERRLCCTVSDNGVGFDVESLHERGEFSLGLTLIRDRLEAVGGTLAIASALNAGTQLHATAPLEA
jgi:two-component system, NarL family, sensor histidine kinase NreB